MHDHRETLEESISIVEGGNLSIYSLLLLLLLLLLPILLLLSSNATGSSLKHTIGFTQEGP